MITKDNIRTILKSDEFGFTESSNTFSRHYGSDEEGFILEYNAGTGEFIYPEGVQADRNTTMDQHQQESFVVFLCVAQLFERGYLPKHLKLEGRNYAGTDKGYCDILVKDNDDVEYLIIECKTADLAKKEDEFRKHWAKTLRNGDQLFRYFNTYRKAKYLCLYAADYPEYTKGGAKANKFENIYQIISLVDNVQRLAEDKKLKSFEQLRRDQGGSDEFFDVWKNTYLQDSNDRGLLEEGVAPFEIDQKVYSIEDLKTVDEYSLEKKYHEFALILRKHTISSHENAFDKLINLFLSKIIDEKYNAKELTLLWKGTATDNYFSLQDRLNILYRQGMKEFFHDEVTYVENRQIDDAFNFLSSKADEGRDTIKKYFRQLKYFNNNPFAFLDVHNEELFYKNAVILKDVISMLQDIYLTSNNDNQFLGDLFEGFLNKGVHQSEGQFFSPIPIVRFLVSSLPLKNIIENSTSIPKAIDYACGSGHFLTEYARQIKPIVEQVKNTDVKNYYEQIVGIEKDYRLSKVSQVAAFMYGMDGIKIHYSDALIDIPDVKDHSFSFLVANPPYSVSGFLETLTEEQRDRFSLSSYVSNIEKNKSIETFFIERSAQLLNSGGVATIILPSSILSKKGLYMHARELMLKYFNIISICCFGPNTFGQTTTSTVALFLKRKPLDVEPCEHFKNRVEAWFCGNMEDDDAYEDRDRLEAYVLRIGVAIEDYYSMLNGELTESFLNTEIIQEYVKALNFKKQNKNSATASLATEAKKIRDEAQSYSKSKTFKQKSPSAQKDDEMNFLLRFIQAIEKEKLYFYLLATDNSQPVLVVQAPLDKAKEKKFLGYEWSTRKGDEGIHYLNTATAKASDSDDEEGEDDTIAQIKGVSGIQTPLFNPSNLEDPLKINSLIRNNFDGQPFELTEETEEVVSQFELHDLLDFSRVDFDKVIKTTAILSYPKIDTSFETDKLKNIAPFVTEKCSFSEIEAKHYISTDNMLQNCVGVVAYDGMPNVERITRYKMGDILVSNIRPYLKKTWYADSDGGCSNDVIVFRNTKPEKVTNEYLATILSSDIFFDYMMVGRTGVKMPRGDKKTIPNFEVPLPPIEIQKQIVNECRIEDIKFRGSINTIEVETSKIVEMIASMNGKPEKISSVCSINSLSKDPTTEPNKEFVYVDIDAVENGTGVVSFGKTILGKNAPSRARRYAEKESTIISTVRPNLKGFAFIETEHEQAIYSTGFAILKSLDIKKISDRMVYYQFMYSSSMMEQMIAAMPKGSYPSINKDNLEKFTIITHIENEKSILAKIKESEEKIASARNYISKHSSMKQAILDKYLK